METQEDIGSEIDALRPIVALLYALAAHASAVARSPWPVRVFVLWVLRRAGRVAADFIGVDVDDDPAWRGNRPPDARSLAMLLRALARILKADLKRFARMLRRALAGYPEPAPQHAGSRVVPRVLGFAGISRTAAVPWPDTS